MDIKKLKKLTEYSTLGHVNKKDFKNNAEGVKIDTQNLVTLEYNNNIVTSNIIGHIIYTAISFTNPQEQKRKISIINDLIKRKGHLNHHIEVKDKDYYSQPDLLVQWINLYCIEEPSYKNSSLNVMKQFQANKLGRTAKDNNINLNFDQIKKNIDWLKSTHYLQTQGKTDIGFFEKFIELSIVYSVAFKNQKQTQKLQQFNKLFLNELNEFLLQYKEKDPNYSFVFSDKSQIKKLLQILNNDLFKNIDTDTEELLIELVCILNPNVSSNYNTKETLENSLKNNFKTIKHEELGILNTFKTIKHEALGILISRTAINNKIKKDTIDFLFKENENHPKFSLYKLVLNTCLNNWEDSNISEKNEIIEYTLDKFNVLIEKNIKENKNIDSFFFKSAGILDEISDFYEYLSNNKIVKNQNIIDKTSAFIINIIDAQENKLLSTTNQETSTISFTVDNFFYNQINNMSFEAILNLDKCIKKYANNTNNIIMNKINNNENLHSIIVEKQKEYMENQYNKNKPSKQRNNIL